jgi:hypothetical protein
MFGRDTAGKWDSSNAQALLMYTAQHHPTFLHGFGLGNEKEFAVTAVDTAGCYNKLREIVNKAWPDESMRPIMIGPDLNPRPDWLSVFLANLDAPDTVTGVSYHSEFLS